ncbi:MAG: hypothetical protein ACOYS2_02845 [Patescibacteria group bacterium]
MNNVYKSFLEKKWVANKIEKRFLNSEPGFFINYEINDFEKETNEPSYYEQVSILIKMDKRNAIKIHEKKFESSLSRKPENLRDNLFRIEILRDGFKKYLEWLKGIENSFDTRTKKTAKKEIQIKALSFNEDGSITYDGKALRMRGQLKELCRLFMKNAYVQITIDDIRDEIITADKRGTIANSTISKYVSELHEILKKSFGKRVIFSQSKEGWTFRP